MTRCVWCGRYAKPVQGIYLEMLYPGRTTCNGCGRLQLHCSCATSSTGAPLRADFVDRFPADRSYVLSVNEHSEDKAA